MHIRIIILSTVHSIFKIKRRTKYYHCLLRCRCRCRCCYCIASIPFISSIELLYVTEDIWMCIPIQLCHSIVYWNMGRWRPNRKKNIKINMFEWNMLELIFELRHDERNKNHRITPYSYMVPNILHSQLSQLIRIIDMYTRVAQMDERACDKIWMRYCSFSLLLLVVCCNFTIAINKIWNERNIKWWTKNFASSRYVCVCCSQQCQERNGKFKTLNILYCSNRASLQWASHYKSQYALCKLPPPIVA